MRHFIKSFHESSHKEWNVFMWVLDTFYSLLGNWLRDHTSWTSSGIRVKIKSLSNKFWSSVLNFTAPRYAFFFLNSETYIVHVINYKWSRSVNFPLCTCIFSNSKPVGSRVVWLVKEWFLVKGESRRFPLVHIFAWNAWTNGKLCSPMCMTPPHNFLSIVIFN